MTDFAPTPLNRRLFVALWLAGAVAAAPSIPATVVLGDAGLLPNPVGWVLATASVMLGAVVVLPLAIFVGLRQGARFGLTAPLTEAWVAGRRVEGAARRLVMAAVAGGGISLVGVLVTVTLAGDIAQPATPMDDIVPWWVGLAQAVSAAVDEELFFRLGVMTLIVWFTGRVMSSEEGIPSDFRMWIAVALSAVIFTMVHSAPSGDAEAAAALVAQPMQFVLLLAGGLFSWLFWKQGLEAAITAHFSYDIVRFYGIIEAV